MIILEFLIFVISSGLFCSEKFRHHIWAVVVAGAIATGSSLLFAYDLGERWMGHGKQPPVITRTVKQLVEKPGVTSEAKTVGKKHSCADQYPKDALRAGAEGVTHLAFKILTDGTVDSVQVLTSSGYASLDEAAVKCASNWHYRPAMKDGQIVESDRQVNITWNLQSGEAAKAAAQASLDGEQKNDTGDKTKPEEQSEAKDHPADPNAKPTHHWYDVGSWFSSDGDKKTQ
ncbi:TonB family protein [Rhizomicrobium palustre]|uniref:TonB family protein n=1 Tax=Rhizomicrobium palustre TaxID=189966 RepID=A0A846N056_9PROT|nr:energy transducer TonB [Rhizomicrobium palustre]NIK88580.1 TonB family protein [Rhizomicrobium palustre]